jgi:hypothetical protein
MDYTVQESCRICKGSLKNVFSLGDIYPSGFVDKTEGKPIPLSLVECENCHLVQEKYNVPLDNMYRTYFYQSAINPSMVSSLQEIVTEIESTVEIKDDDVLVDIGCNDGTLFTLYKNQNSLKVGFDPALNLADKAKSHCDFFINDYFQDNYPVTLGKAKVITAIAMFYDLPDPNKFMDDIDKIIADDGIFVVQFTDLASMLKINAFDNICFEHLEYYKLADIVDLFYKHNFTVFRVSYNRVNGGSIRIFASRLSTFPIEKSVTPSIMGERIYLDSAEGSMKAFSARIKNVKHIVLEFLQRSRDGGLVIYGLGASTKGNVVLQYFGINKNLLKAIGELNKDKFGKVTVGTEIPIISEEDVFKEYPDLLLLLPWHFLDTFINKNIKFLMDGGAFIVTMPLPMIYYMEENKIKGTPLEEVLP